MELLTLYVGQGALAAVRTPEEAIVIDAHMPTTDHVTADQIDTTLKVFLERRRVRGLVITGLDRDHAHPEGVTSILRNHSPDWVMYPKCYKDTDCASEMFDAIAAHERARAATQRPLKRVSVRLDRLESRYLAGLANDFTLELFSPHIEDMDNSNNSSIVLKLTGVHQGGFTYLITGDTETERWERISDLFGPHLAADVLAAPHHGSRTGISAAMLFHIAPHTVLISAGVDNQFEHPHSSAVVAYGHVAKHVFATNTVDGGTCFFTSRSTSGIRTEMVRHEDAATAANDARQPTT